MIDFHVHLVGWVPDERRLSEVDCTDIFEKVLCDMDDAGIDAGLVMLLDENWIRRGIPEIDRLHFCPVVDIGRAYERDVMLGSLKLAADKIKGVKIHPLLQTASYDDYLCLARAAGELGLFTVIHADGDEGIHIAEYLAGKTGAPLVIAHSGGVDFSRAVCLADKHADVMLELSCLNLPVVDKALAWGVEVLGEKRFLYGSDYPYQKRSVGILPEKILHDNALALLGGKL